MQIEIPNLLAKGFELEIFQDQTELIRLVNESVPHSLWRPFIEGVLEELKHDSQEWIMWEGFWEKEDDGTKTEVMVAALHLEGTIYTRGMRVKLVPQEREEEVQNALTVMVDAYMQRLALELKNHKAMEKPYTPFGEGKTKKWQCSICHEFKTKDQFGHGYGNNARPVNNGRCCDYCDRSVVIPARLARMKTGLKPYEGGPDDKVIQGIMEAIKRGEEIPGLPVSGKPAPPGTVEIPLDQIKTVWDQDDDRPGSSKTKE